MRQLILEGSHITNDQLVHLSKIEELDISDCFLISDISKLSSVRKLTIKNCYSLKAAKLTTKGYVEQVNFKGCDNLSDVSIEYDECYVNKMHIYSCFLLDREQLERNPKIGAIIDSYEE